VANLSERLQVLKLSRGLLQKDIAKDCSLSLRSYQYYERGQVDPTATVLIALADYFDVSLDYLVGRSDDPARY
jgi:transcriptional regulator with XRE-family HTH domain